MRFTFSSTYPIPGRCIDRFAWGSARNIEPILSDALLEKPGEAGHVVCSYGLPLWSKSYFSVSFEESGKFITRAEFRKHAGFQSGNGLVERDFLELDPNK